MRRIRDILLPLYMAGALLGLGGCGGDPGTGPVDVKWDRDACEHCRMVVSDRLYAAEVRGGPRNQVYKFDDLGCALNWLEKQSWPDKARAEIWVQDHRDGTWLDARAAHYVPGQVTPMDYGLGASAQAAPDSLSFAQARDKILSHRHGGSGSAAAAEPERSAENKHHYHHD